MVAKVSMVLLLAASACLAHPMPEGEAGAEVKSTHGKTDTLNVFANQNFQTKDERGRLDLSGNHLRELGGENRHQTNAQASGAYDFLSGDRGKATVFGDHQSTWNSDAPNTHSTNAGVSGTYDVFSGDRGKATVFGGHQRTWNSDAPNTHSTNAGVSGTYDVFRSDDGNTKGTLFGSHQQNWFSDGTNSKATEIGGRVTHSWGR